MAVVAKEAPRPVGGPRHLGDALGSINRTLGTAFYYGIGLHIAAGLWHQFVRRDDLLKRMW